MKRKKSFDWYGAKQRFSIRTYHFGAASVLLGLTLATGAQAVQAEELAADTTVTSSIQSPATTDTTPAISTETATPTERTATINYLVNYVLEDGTLVNAVVKTATVTTTEAVASTSVDVAVEVPAGYELAQGQATTVTQVVTEGAENLVTVQLVKQAEVAAPTTEVATEAPATTTEAATETPAEATEVSAPVTAEEAKVVLEQNISEAVVLSDEANRLYAAAPEGNESLKAAADATKLAATEATTVLKDSVATLVQVNAQIDAVRTNVEALALELRKRDEDGVITANLSITNTTEIGKGDGTFNPGGVALIEPTPGMSDPNGAKAKSASRGTMVATTTEGYLTFKYYSFAWYDGTVGVERGYGFSSTNGAYIRVSIAQDLSGTLLVELLDKTNNVLESKSIKAGDTVEFTTFKDSAGGKPIVVDFDSASASTDAEGTLKVLYDENTLEPNVLVPKVIGNTTTYKTEDGTILGTYTIATIPGLENDPSGVRTFPGYELVRTETTATDVSPESAIPFVSRVRQGYPTNASQVGKYIAYKTIITPIPGTHSYTESIWIADPNYTGTHDFRSISTDGFIKVFESSVLSNGVTNTNYMLPASLLDTYTVTKLTTDPNNSQLQIESAPITDPAELDLSKLQGKRKIDGKDASNEWFKIDLKENPDFVYLARFQIGVSTTGQYNKLELHFGRDFDPKNPTNPGTTIDPVTGKEVSGLDLTGQTLPYTFSYAGVNMTETTHVYKPVPQEAIIRYQVEGEAGYLEESATLTGNPGTDINYSTTDTINKYKKLGYELVSDNFTTEAGQDYDYDSDKLQEFLVVIKPRIEEVPKTAVPGEPVDPTDPNSPVWPATVENLKTTQEVTRTVEYKYEDGTPVRVDAAGNILPKDSTEGTPLVKTETVTFTRPAQVNLVTGEITYGDWVADTTDTLKGNVLPEVSGYTASRTTLEGADAPMTETVKDKTVTATDADINEVVYYKENPKYGDVVVNYVNTDGKVIASPVVDTNDALVGTDYSTADRVPEKIVEDATGDVYYYKEIKPEDATKETGTVVEGTTEVTYVYEKAGNVVVNYVTEDGTPIKTPVNDETNAKPGTEYNTTDNKPTEITGEDGSRYVLIPSKTIGSETGTVEGGKTTEITYVYKKVANWIPQIPGVPEGQEPKVPYPFDPTNPDKPIDPTSPYPDGEVPSIPHVPGFTPVDPKTNEPLKPVDPNDPGKGYVPPTPDESGKDTPIPYVQNGNVVVNYVTEDGTPIKTPVNDETNAPAGKSYDTTDNKPTEIIGEDGSRYVLIPSKTIGSETGTVEGGKTTEITYVYKKVANWIPEIPATPENPTPVNPVIPYPFDPTNPDKPIDPTSPYPDGEVPSIPHVPGFTPVDPKDNTPLTPVDPEDPSKGYVPPTPDESGKDTPIPYVQNGNVVVNYVTEDGTPIKTPVNDETNAPAGKSYDTTDNKPTEIIGEDGSRYVLIPSKTIGSETGTVEGGKTTEITYVYKKVANWIPEIPATPENPTPVNPVIPYPFDPTNPDKPIDPTSPYP
ncbi:MucBP domain-containing protein, partial [Streptococcus sp. P25B114]